MLLAKHLRTVLGSAFAALVAAACLVFAPASATPALAAGSSISDATTASMNTTYSGTISESNEQDFYKVTLSSAGRLNINMTTYMVDQTRFAIYDSDGSDTVYSTSWYNDDTAGQITKDLSVDLTAGTYYLCIYVNFWYGDGGNYTFSLGFTSAGETIKEAQGGDNNTLATADSISLNTTYKGQIAKNDSKDFYKFTLNSASTIKLSCTLYMRYLYWYIYDSTGNKVYNYSQTWNSTTEQDTDELDISLDAGTYYLAIVENDYTGNYSFKITLSLGSPTITLSKDTYTYNGSARKPSVTVTTSNGTKLTNGTDYTVSYSNNTNAGTATVTVTGCGDYAGTATTTFTIKAKSVSSATVKLSYSSTTYSGKAKKPSVKSVKLTLNGSTVTLTKGTDYTVSYSSNTKVGTATVKITGTGNYTGTVKKTFKIKPKTVTLKSAKSSAAKKATITWTKLSSANVTKYQIRYRVKGTSTWKTVKVSSSKSSYTLTGLKSGKTYQVQVRAYKTVSGTNYTGSWSSTKTVKVK